MRRGGVLCAALLLAGASALAQGLPRNTPWQLRHLQTVRVERTQRFLDAFDAADEARRAPALRLLEELGRAGAAPGALPDIAALDAATRVLAGAAPESVRQDALARFADALDLQVVPGAFEPAHEGRGEPLVVRVYLLYPAALDGEVELMLLWRAPDGRELEARSEPFASTAFGGAGFDMYLRAPLSEPGTWRLVPEVRQRPPEGPDAHGGPGDEAARSARGAGVEVACIAGFAARVRALRSAEPEGPAGGVQGDDALGDLLRLLGHGLRSAQALAPAELLERLEHGEFAGVPERLAGLDPRLSAWGLFGEGGASESAAPGGTAAAAPDVVFVVLVAHGETAAALFHGPRGAGWSELARAPGHGVVALEAARAPREVLVEALRDLARRRPGAALCAVALGDAASVLQLALAGQHDLVPGPLQGLVLCASLQVPGPGLPDVPILLVSALATDGGRGNVTSAAGAPLPLFDEAELPARVRAWWNGR